MTSLMERTATTPEAWRDGMAALYRSGLTMIEAGQRPKATLTEDEDTLTLRQLRFIHGPILKQISEQVRVNGVLFDRPVWKEHLKDLFLPDEWEMVQAPFVRDAKTGALRPSKRKVPRKKQKSLTHLGGKRRSEFIDWVLAYAATEWGVVFRFIWDEREACRYHPPKRKPAQTTEPARLPAPQQREAVPA